MLGPNKHGLVTYIQVNVYIGNTLSWLNIVELSKLAYVEDKIIISPLFLCISFEFSSKSNGLVIFQLRIPGVTSYNLV